jgi:hypothetical protein
MMTIDRRLEEPAVGAGRASAAGLPQEPLESREALTCNLKMTETAPRTELETKGSRVYQVQPIEDPRWDKLLERHPRSSVFHTSEWLDALRRTYGYEPLVYTTSSPGMELENGIVLCRVNSWLTGRRVVSLPFSDHCEPLLRTNEDLARLRSALVKDLEASKAKYIEIHSIDPTGIPPNDFRRADSFCLHQLDLRAKPEVLFQGFHKDCVQRKIRRAQREKLLYEEGTSESQLLRFYELLVMTRRRQRLPPQPLAWFRNLIACMGPKLTIRLASKDGRAVAAILTLQYKDTMVYKYACSDSRFHKLGGVQLLIWKAIEAAMRGELSNFDLGRSDWNNPGLIAFKDRWGSSRSAVTSWRCGSQPALSSGQVQIARLILGTLPTAVLPLVGSLLYKHLHRP